MQGLIQKELKKENDALIAKSEGWIKKNVTWISPFSSVGAGCCL